MKRAMAYLPVVLGIASLFVFPCRPVQASEESGSDKRLEALRKCWRTRASKFDSVKFEWNEVCELEKHSLRRPEVMEPGLPAKKVKVKHPQELMLRGNWMRYASKALRPSADGSSISLTDYTSGYDGKSSRMLFSDDTDLSGSIRKEKRNTDSRTASLRPLLYFAWPFDTEIGLVDPSSLKIVGENEKAGTLEIEANANRRFVVDPQRDYLILSWSRQFPSIGGGHPIKGGDLMIGQMEYRKHKELGWVPARWELETFSPVDPDVCERRYTATVKRIEADKKYDQSLFQIQFPPGTRVFDHYTGKEYMVPKK